MRFLSPLFLLVAALAGCASPVRIGMPKADVLARLGPPERTLAFGGGEALIYPQRVVALENGRVRAVPGPTAGERRGYLVSWATDLKQRGVITPAEFEAWQRAALTER
jgi:hypothetical protein